MIKRARLTTVGVVAYLLFAVGGAPAAQVLRFAAPHLGGVKVQDPRGTLWSGTAGAVRYENIAIGNVEWQWRPWALLLGRLEYGVQFDENGANGDARIGRGVFGGWRLRDVDATLGGARVNAMVPLGAVGLGGDFVLKLDEVKMADGALAASGEVEWRQAGLRAPMEIPLGVLHLQLAQRDTPGLHGVLTDREGPFEVQGEVALGVGGNYSAQGSLLPRPPLDPAVQNILGFLGTADAQGRYAFNFSGTLP